MTRIIVAGDLCPKDRVATLLDDRQFSFVFDEIKPLVAHADYALVNLEAPIVTGNIQPILKAGPNLKCSNKVTDALRYLGFSCVTLANNHFRDYGEEGVINTLKELNENGIDYVGAGRTLNEAGRVFYKHIGDEVVAFINCCEHEYSIATENTAGSNPLDIIEQYHTIKEARHKAQHVIVIVHGGIEHYQLPTPRMVKTYRFFIDVGADVVINHHQHCYSGYEVYKNKPIFYGLGNFCFDWNGKRQSNWNEGYMVELFLEKQVSFCVIPYVQSDNEPTIRLMDNNEKEKFNNRIGAFNCIIQNAEELEREFDSFVERTRRGFDPLHPYVNRWLKALYMRGMLPSFFSEKKLISIQNKINCESHLERLIRLLNMRLENKTNG